MTPKIPTASSISRLLRKAGYTRADIDWGHAGFSVTKHYNTGAVRVGHYSNTMGTNGGLNEVKLDSYARTITEAGYDVSRPNPQWLIVTAKTEEA